MVRPTPRPTPRARGVGDIGIGDGAQQPAPILHNVTHDDWNIHGGEHAITVEVAADPDQHKASGMHGSTRGLL
jgi:hypothetical protein